MYNTMNNPSAHPSYSHYYLLRLGRVADLYFPVPFKGLQAWVGLYTVVHCTLYPVHCFFFFFTSYCFLHILLFFAHLFAHLIVLHFFYFIAHFTLISPFLTICMPLCYVTLYNLYSYYFALSTERTWFDYISLLIIPCITIMWQIKKPWPWPWEHNKNTAPITASSILLLLTLFFFVYVVNAAHKWRRCRRLTSLLSTHCWCECNPLNGTGK